MGELPARRAAQNGNCALDATPGVFAARVRKRKKEKELSFSLLRKSATRVHKERWGRAIQKRAAGLQAGCHD